MTTTHRRRQAFYALPSAHWQLLSEPPFSLLDKFNEVDDAIDANADIADAILTTGLASFGLPAHPNPEDPHTYWHGTATPSDLSKAHSTIRQFYRDWSAEGWQERRVCYDPVLRILHEAFSSPNPDDLNDERRSRSGSNHSHALSPIRVLVPGAGLGRLVFELCRAGYAAEGNEISYHQLLASSWVLNHTQNPEQYALFPFVSIFSNVRSRQQQLKQVMIPDVHPGSVIQAAMENQQAPQQQQQQKEDDDHEGPKREYEQERAQKRKDLSSVAMGSMSMSAADFVVLYGADSQRHAFDAVATVFFIDTAPNLIRYLEAISNCLKPGGIWINVGPLLWHFEHEDKRSPSKDHHNQQQLEVGIVEEIRGTELVALSAEESSSTRSSQGIGEPGSVELTEEEVFHLVRRFGFEIEPKELPPDSSISGYIQDPDSMLLNVYRPSAWVARKNREST